MQSQLRRVILLSAACCIGRAALAQGVITTIAGADWLFPGNGGKALNAPLSETFGLDLTVDSSGGYYIGDDGNLMVMHVGTDGIVNVVAGNGFGFTSGDGGLAVNAGLLDPISIAVDRSGNIYVGEFGGAVRKVTTDGVINRIAGTGVRGYGGDNGPAINAQLNEPYGLLVDSAGNLYIADTENNRIRKVDPSGQIATIAGTGVEGFSGNGGPAVNAELDEPTRMAMDSAGDLFFVDSSNFVVRKIDTKGIITTVAGGGRISRDGSSRHVRRYDSRGDRSRCHGKLYIADRFLYAIREVDTQGKIHTIAGGSGTSGYDGDGGPRPPAHFQLGIFAALAVDSTGNYWSPMRATDASVRSLPTARSPPLPATDCFASPATAARPPARHCIYPSASPKTVRETSFSPNPASNASGASRPMEPSACTRAPARSVTPAMADQPFPP